MKKHVNVKYIEEKLIPFILRKQGRGFAMEHVISIRPAGSRDKFDGVERVVPSCGTVCCIKGSILVLEGGKRSSDEWAGSIIGLTPQEADGLFYAWHEGEDSFGWQKTFASRFARANTPLGKAKVAVAFLREICRTDAKCLHKEHQCETK